MARRKDKKEPLGPDIDRQNQQMAEHPDNVAERFALAVSKMRMLPAPQKFKKT